MQQNLWTNEDTAMFIRIVVYKLRNKYGGDITLNELAIRDVGPVTFPAYEASEASLRSLAEEKELPIEDVVELAETNSLNDIIKPKEEVVPEEPTKSHSPGVPASSFIR